MSILILVLFIGLFMHDALVALSQGDPVIPLITGLHDVWVLVAVIGPKLLILLLFHLLVRRAMTATDAAAASVALRRLEFRGAKLRDLLILSYLADLFVFGGLLRIRALTGDLVLIDEIIILLPPLITTFLLWLSYYPVDARMRQATFMSRIERGLPVEIWSRGQYLLANLRHQWALMGLPLLLLAGWAETVQQVLGPRLSEGWQAGLLLGGSLTVFLFTPLIIRHIWDTTPLPAGELRERLMAMCRQHRVGVRELLLWRTFGGMINGAVMGLIRPLRYILLTDALLESMPAKQVEAVMAHGLAHVRKHHMFWLLLVAASSMELLRRLAELSFAAAVGHDSPVSVAGLMPASLVATLREPQSVAMIAMLISLAGWALIFGWVSRRFERQADTFAVQHLARQWHEINPTGISETDSQRRVGMGDMIGMSGTSGMTPIGPLPSPQEMVAALERGEMPAGFPDLHMAARQTTPIAPGSIPRDAAMTMDGALQNVADLNFIPTRKRSWRHGSIAWRQSYLRTLPGQPIDNTAIDRVVARIKIGGIVVLVCAVVLNVWVG